MVSRSVSIPVIAHGGAGKKEHINDVIIQGKADAVAIASMIHYDFIKNNKVNMDGKTEGNTDFLESGRHFSRIQEPSNLLDIKQFMREHSIKCRL